jgi:PEP-CTERM motif
MLKRMPIILAIAGATLAGAAPANALSLVIDFIPGDQPQSLRGLAIVEDFEDETPGAPYGGGLAIFANSVAGQAARPAFGLSTGNFLAVQAGQTSSITITVPQTQALSFVIGSLDSYNRVVLNFLSGASVLLDGAAIVSPFGSPANGNQTAAATNGRVFYDTLGTDSITSFTLSSIGLNAFEIDDIAVAAPEPATWGMMLLATGMAGAVLRRRRTAKLA